MNIIITAGEALEKGVWQKVCVLKGFDEYCVAEGTMDDDERIELTEDEATSLGLIKE